MKKNYLVIPLILGVIGGSIVLSDSGLDSDGFLVKSEVTDNNGKIFTGLHGLSRNVNDSGGDGGVIDDRDMPEFGGVFEFTVNLDNPDCSDPAIYLGGVSSGSKLISPSQDSESGITPINGKNAINEEGQWRIEGKFSRLGNNSQRLQSASCITSVDRWDDEIEVNNLSYAFRYASNLTHIESIPTGVTNMNNMFYSATSFNQDISHWDVSSVTNMSYMFSLASSFNNDNQALNWSNTGKVTNMSGMFHNARTFNQDISDWDVSSVTNMSYMFSLASSFDNGGSPLDWGNKTSKVTNMSFMFRGSSAFDQDISSWDVSSVDNMSYMFSEASSFNNDDQTLDWGDKTSNVTNMRDMFNKASNFNQDISSWDTSSVTYMNSMFEAASNFNQDISRWNVSEVTNMNRMFVYASNFNQDLSGWRVPLIASKPTYFDTGTQSGFLNNPAKQPNLGWTLYN